MSFGRLRIAARVLALFLLSVPCFAQISINEILADNTDLNNSDGSVSDWVELYNAGAQPATLTGYSLTDNTNAPQKWIVPNNVKIPANGFLLILLDSTRAPSTVLASPLNAGFSIKASGDQLVLYSPTGQLVESVRFGPQAPNYSIGRVPAAVRSFILCNPTPGSANIEQPLGPQTALKINEWMASPSSGNDWFELYNPGPLPVQLSGMYFTDDGNIPSRAAPFSFIGSYLKITANNSTNDNEVNFGLGGKGDSISLFTGAGALVNSVHFLQQAADVSEGRLPDGSLNIKALTKPTPGDSNLIPYPGLVVNELLSHTDPPIEDAVEFYNQSSSPIDISGWYLSNTRDNLKKYRVANGTIVKPKSYAVFYQYQFGPGEDDDGTDPNLFTFNSAHGDQVFLSQATAAGDLTGYIVSEKFETAEHGFSFGRYNTSVAGDYKFVAMDHLTFGGPDVPATLDQFRTGQGATNSAPKVGPVVISEMMYHPSSTAVDGSDNVTDEYIELRNITAQSLPLYDPAHPENHWRLQGGVSFSFPSGAILPPLGIALVISFDPAKNGADLATFRTKYGVPQDVQIFGGYSGKLNNGGDAVELYKPDTPQEPPHPDVGYVPYFRIDKVNYRNLAPWPSDADGTGKSLQRKNITQFGNDPINWQAAAPTAGQANSGEVTDTDGDGLPDLWEGRFGLDPNNPTDAALDNDGDGFSNLQEYLAGTDPRNPGSHLSLRIISSTAAGASVSFPSVPGKSYSVQYRNSLLPSTVWQKLISTNATGTSVTVQDGDAAAKITRFYRLATPAVD